MKRANWLIPAGTAAAAIMMVAGCVTPPPLYDDQTDKLISGCTRRLGINRGAWATRRSGKR